MQECFCFFGAALDSFGLKLPDLDSFCGLGHCEFQCWCSLDDKVNPLVKLCEMHTEVGLNNRVSVIIVNWNGERFLERCLAALMAQTVKPHEIILVDNASSDRSLEIVCQFPSVRLMELERNTGFAQSTHPTRIQLAMSDCAQHLLGNKQ